MQVSTDGLSAADLTGQCIMAGFDGLAPSPGILDLIQHERVGGVILFRRNIGSADQLLSLTSALQQAARESGHPAPLLIGIDQENGAVRRLGAWATEFPGAMALAAASSMTLAEEVAEASGRELAALGVTINFAPVADVNTNPNNPVIGARSFGDDPARVARFVAAQTRGYQRAGVAATLKHFPGHGDTATDSHLALPAVPFDHARLNTVELEPFRAGIAAGAAAVMTAHIALPALTGSPTTPATLAPAVIQGVLRDELGFDGAVITDCLEMAAIVNGVGVDRAAALALSAGADIVLVSHREERQRAALAAIRQAAASGAIAADALVAGASRVLALKQRFTSWESVDHVARGDSLHLVGDATHRALARCAYDDSVSIIRDEQRLLPLRLAPDARVMVISVEPLAASQVADLSESAGALVSALARDYSNTELIILCADSSPAAREAAVETASRADAVILLTHDLSRVPEQAATLDEIVTRLRGSGRKIIGVATGAPYDAARLSAIGTWIAVYDASAPALEAAARALTGALRPTGRLPVKLPA